MRRTTGLLFAVGLLASGCSSGDDSDTDTDTGPTTTTADSDESGGAGEDAASTDPGPGPTNVPDDGPVELPGLLDPSTETLADDDAVRTGELDNGLLYYVRRNDNPGGKAELRLAIRAGSVDEFGPSTGVAHFVEHMLFNGTERFPENELIDVLRSFGARFGPDINAYTSFDETVYSLSVPNADETVELGLTVLDEWLNAATFDPAQVVAERGVVLDEWRVRTQSTSGRLFEVAAELYLSGSPYEDRSPIGTDTSIAAMEDPELVDYYEAWYRTDNAAIVVVGDIDVGEVVADIERIFGDIPEPDGAMPPRPDTSFAIDRAADFGLHVDPDQQTVDVEVTLPLPAFDGDGTAGIRADLLDRMIFSALVRRLQQDVAAGGAPFDEVVPGSNSFVDTLDAPALYAFTDAARVGDTLDALLDEYVRAARFGFTADETDVARDAIRATLDARYDGRDSAQDRDFADQYVADFLDATGFPSIETEYEATVAVLDAITPAALDLRFRARWAHSSPHVIISTPEADADRMPDRDEVLGRIDSAIAREVADRTPLRDLPDALMDRPDPVEPASTELLLPFDDPFLDPIELTYPNGVRVILNSNPIVEGQVFFQARSPGGSSLVDDADVVDALYAADVVTSGGVADFNRAELAQLTAGDDVTLDAWLTPYDENFAGAAATADVEVLLQLVHLYMTQPRFDPVALGQVRSFVGPVVADPASDPSTSGEDALLDARYPGELRYATLPEPEQFETLDLDGVERVWRDRFGNADGWVFVLSGDIDIDAVGDLADAYLGSLPAGDSETWRDVEDPPPSEVVSVERRAGTGDTASATLLFTRPIAGIDARLRATADVVNEVVSARLTDVIREQLGDSYSPFAVTQVTVDPDPVVQTFVFVTGAPDRVDAIGGLVVDEIADIAANGPREQEFRNAFAQVQEEYGFVDNGTFLRELVGSATHPALELDDYVFEFAELENVTAESVRRYVADHMPTDAYIQVTVLPR